MHTIGIIGAMEEEVALLKEKMTEVEVTKKADMEFFRGNLMGHKAVVVRSGIGKVNAGICTQILADDFQVEAVIKTGIAGAFKAEINIGDIVDVYKRQPHIFIFYADQNIPESIS